MKFKGIIISILIVLLVLYITNPTKSEFNEYVSTEVVDILEENGLESNSFIEQLLTSIVSEGGGKASDIFFNRKDYQIFSIYEVEGMSFDYKYIGIFRKFIQIDNSIDISKINNMFADIKNIFDEKEILKEDYYQTLSFSISSPSEVTVEINPTSGPDIEYFIFDEENHQKWLEFLDGSRDAEDIRAIQREINNLKSHKESFTLETGNWYLIVDNTDNGTIHPPMNLEDDVSEYTIKVSSKKI